MFCPGFTLLELLVVLVIISLVAGFVGPRLAGSLTQLQLKTGAKKLASALRYARSQAASQCTPYVALLDFEDSTTTIQAHRPATDAEGRATETEDLHKPRPRHFQLPEGIRFEKAVLGDDEWDAGTFVIGFYPDGGSTGGRVILADEKDRRYAVDVDFITGTVILRALEQS